MFLGITSIQAEEKVENSYCPCMKPVLSPKQNKQVQKLIKEEDRSIPMMKYGAITPVVKPIKDKDKNVIRPEYAINTGDLDK